MGKKVISQAYVDHVNNSIRNLADTVTTVVQEVRHVNYEIDATRQDLSRLEQQFNQFYKMTVLAGNMQMAQTELVKIKQELGEQYGHYAQIRRHTTGVLQAADAKIIRQVTIDTAAEELMLNAPRYWLAPALVALSAWLRDDKELATRALSEAQRRSDEKTSLFFALVCRRAGRDQACKVWMDRYLGIQSPHEIGRATLILLDAVVNGVFGNNVRSHCSSYITRWVQELATEPEFRTIQREQWRRGFESKTPNHDFSGQYKYLVRHGSEWNEMNKHLNVCCIHNIILDYLKNIFEGPVNPPRSIVIAVDDLLTKLVTNADDEELPLFRSERLNELIIEESGDRETANKRFEAESLALEARNSFTQVLTNISLHPELAETSRMTQRFAIAASKEWALEAYDDLTGRLRSGRPRSIRITIDEWSGETSDGSNETDLQVNLVNDLNQREREEMEQAQIPKFYLAVPIIAACLGLYGLITSSGFMGVLFLGGLIWYGVKMSQSKNNQAKIVRRYQEYRQHCLGILRATLAEVVDWCAHVNREDAISDQTRDFLNEINPEQHALASLDGGRRLQTTE